MGPALRDTSPAPTRLMASPPINQPQPLPAPAGQCCAGGRGGEAGATADPPSPSSEEEWCGCVCRGGLSGMPVKKVGCKSPGDSGAAADSTGAPLDRGGGEGRGPDAGGCKGALLPPDLGGGEGKLEAVIGKAPPSPERGCWTSSDRSAQVEPGRSAGPRADDGGAGGSTTPAAFAASGRAGTSCADCRGPVKTFKDLEWVGAATMSSPVLLRPKCTRETGAAATRRGGQT